jgi:hypothetical protein
MIDREMSTGIAACSLRMWFVVSFVRVDYYLRFLERLARVGAQDGAGNRAEPAVLIVGIC